MSLSVGIEYCTFSYNVANSGSAVTAIYRRFDNLLYADGLIIHLTNVHADYNNILPDATLRYSSTNVITGVFYSYNSRFNFSCMQFYKQSTFSILGSLFFSYSVR